jgi:hypothetical protein
LKPPPALTGRRPRLLAALGLLAAVAPRAHAEPILPTTPLPPPAQAAPPPAQAAPPPPAAADAFRDEDGQPKLSLPTEADRDAWLRSGFRLGLGASYGRLYGLDHAPDGHLLGVLVRLGLRLDADWSVLASFQYQRASQAGGLSGLRFAGTLDPTWHATRHLSLAVGLGFGGIVEGSTGRPDVDPLGSTLSSSYTLPSGSPPLPSCSGVGAAGLARVGWSTVLGPRSAMNVDLEAIGQWTGCVQDTGRVEPDSAKAIVRRQWWPHVGATAAWGITWR